MPSPSGSASSLSARLSSLDLEEILARLTGGSLYAYRDSISEGYVSAGGGVRVGVIGVARYECGTLVGISDVSALNFRIPSGKSSFEKELREAFFKSERGLLIYSAPGAGKTSALRTLASSLGSGRGALKIAVIDERREFLIDDYLFSRVDVLSGYKKWDGLEIALRALSPEVVMLDEIGSLREAEALLPYVNSGVKIVETAHAGSYEELLLKKNLEGFFALSVFDVFVGLERRGGEFFCEVRGKND